MRPTTTLPFFALLVSAAFAQESPIDWPPKLGEPYPDLLLIDASGRELRLSSLKGKVLLIEPIGMNCPACQAYAGGGARGGFRGVSPQGDLRSIEEYLPS